MLLMHAEPNPGKPGAVAGPFIPSFEWNATNQLKRVTNNGVEVGRYSYDPLGRRVEKVAGGVTTSYVYDGMDILRENRDGTISTYIHGPRIDEPLAKEAAGTLSYFHADGLGSVVKNTDQSGAVTSTIRHDAWGNIESGMPDLYAFTGREWDAETGLYYYRARYYDPKVGRFVGEDPIGFTGGVNLFRYVGNRPTTLTDPLGLMSPDEVVIFEANEGRPLEEDLTDEAREAIAWFLDALDLALNGQASRDPDWKLAVVPIRFGKICPSLDTLRRSAVQRAWELEADLVRRTGRGTRPWTQAEIRELLAQGKVTGYQGHHINNVANNPALAGNPDNVTFLRRMDHFDAHGRKWQNPTSGPLLSR